MSKDKKFIILAIITYIIMEIVKFFVIFNRKTSFIGIILSILGAIICVILTILLFRRDFDKNKYYSVLDIGSTVLLFVNVISGILLFITIYDIEKDKIKKIMPDMKGAYPRLKPIKEKYPIIYLIPLLCLTSLFYIEIPFLDNLPYEYIDLIFESFLFIATFIVYYRYVKRDLIMFIKNFKKYISKSFGYFFVGMFICIIISVILNSFIGEATNQELLESYFSFDNIGIYFITTVIMAPFAEEILYRGFVRRLFKKDIIFIIFSGLLFGLLHVTGFDQPWYQYLWILYYGGVGATFAYLYSISDNIFVPMIYHIYLNFFATIGIIIQLVSK